MAEGFLKSMFGSLEAIRSFLVREPMPGFMPEPLEQYEADLIGEYEQQCGEPLGAQSSIHGGTVFQDIGAEQRFSQSMSGFFARPEWATKWVRITAQGELLRPSLLRLYYRRHLDGGANCPEGSPVRLRVNLADRYVQLLEKLQNEIENREIDLMWDDVAEHSGGEADAREKRRLEGEIELLKGAIRLIEAVVPIVKNPETNSSQLLVHEILISILEDPARRMLGLKLFNMLEVAPEKKLSLLPRFEELVAAAGGYGSPLFHALLEILIKPGGEGLFLRFFRELPANEGSEPDPLIERLVSAAAERDITDATGEYITRALEQIADPENREIAEQMVSLFERPVKASIKNDPALSRNMNALLQKPNGTVLFFKFYARLPDEADGQIDTLVRRLLDVAVAGDLEVVPRIFVLKALDMLSDEGKHNLAIQIVNLLENPAELQKMRESASAEEYMRDYKSRKGSGGTGANGTGGPSIPPAVTPQSADGEITAAAIVSCCDTAITAYREDEVFWQESLGENGWQDGSYFDFEVVPLVESYWEAGAVAWGL